MRDLYLELLIGALTHTIYEGVDRLQPPERLRKKMVEAFETSPERWRALMDRERGRAEGRDWPLFAQTMIGASAPPTSASWSSA